VAHHDDSAINIIILIIIIIIIIIISVACYHISHYLPEIAVLVNIDVPEKRYIVAISRTSRR